MTPKKAGWTTESISAPGGNEVTTVCPRREEPEHGGQAGREGWAGETAKKERTKTIRVAIVPQQEDCVLEELQELGPACP